MLMSYQHPSASRWQRLIDSAGNSFSQPDSFIAATTMHHGLTVASRDTREYERAGVPVVNPWQS